MPDHTPAPCTANPILSFSLAKQEQPFLCPPAQLGVPATLGDTGVVGLLCACDGFPILVSGPLDMSSTSQTV